MEYGLKPLYNDSSKILILGSLPSVKSIKANEYYGNSTNHFWRILRSIFENTDKQFNSYEEKKAFLINNHIAVWDVLKAANRKGSLDSNIKEFVYNDIDSLLTNNNFNKVLVNGKKAESLLLSYMKKTGQEIKYILLPSSSAANTRYTIKEKTDIWRSLIN